MNLMNPMKQWLVVILSLTLWACDSKKGNSNAIVPPPSSACMNGVSFCNNSLYANYQGFSPYPVNPYYYGGFNNYLSSSQWGSWGNNFTGSSHSSLCDCPQGSVPTYNASMGLGCVNAPSYAIQAGAYLSWGWGTNTNGWVNIPQVSNLNGASSIGSCYNGAVQSCFVNSPTLSCGVGLICQPLGGGSSMGLCGNFATGSNTGIR